MIETENQINNYNWNILLVDDEPFLVELLSGHFSKKGVKMNVMHDAETAYSFLEDNSNNKIDLILLDLILPGMSGYDFLEKIKKDKRFSSIPVIILSNLGQDTEVKRATELGADSFLVKAHFDMDEIFNIVKKHLT
jgi:DNA-binding response OmpR family regulator